MVPTGVFVFVLSGTANVGKYSAAFEKRSPHFGGFGLSKVLGRVKKFDQPFCELNSPGFHCIPTGLWTLWVLYVDDCGNPPGFD